MSEWQDIATAPKNGTRVMIGYINGFVGCASFRTKPPRGWLRDGGGKGAEPTHWMPLPKPPQDTSP